MDQIYMRGIKVYKSGGKHFMNGQQKLSGAPVEQSGIHHSGNPIDQCKGVLVCKSDIQVACRDNGAQNA